MTKTKHTNQVSFPVIN